MCGRADVRQLPAQGLDGHRIAKDVRRLRMHARCRQRRRASTWSRMPALGALPMHANPLLTTKAPFGRCAMRSDIGAIGSPAHAGLVAPTTAARSAGGLGTVQHKARQARAKEPEATMKAVNSRTAQCAVINASNWITNMASMPCIALIGFKSCNAGPGEGISLRPPHAAFRLFPK